MFSRRWFFSFINQILFLFLAINLCYELESLQGTCSPPPVDVGCRLSLQRDPRTSLNQKTLLGCAKEMSPTRCLSLAVKERARLALRLPWLHDSRRQLQFSESLENLRWAAQSQETSAVFSSCCCNRNMSYKSYFLASKCHKGININVLKNKRAKRAHTGGSGVKNMRLLFRS